MRHRNPAVRTLVMAALLTLACNMPSPRIAGPEPPLDAPIPSDEALESFADKVEALSAAPPTGPFAVTFTEAELTSALAEAITQQEAGAGESLSIQNPQVLLRDGQMSIYTTLDLDGTQVDGLVVTQPVIGADGLIDVVVTGVEFGPLVVDPSQLDLLAGEIERAINEPIQASPADVNLTGILIADGQMTVSGSAVP